MKYIFITFSGLSMPIAYKLQQSGYEVHVGIIEDIKDYVIEEEIAGAKEPEFDKKRRLELYQGLLNVKPAQKIVDWMKTVQTPKEYFVFFEENNLYRWADKVKDLGFEGNFPTKEDFFLEIDRDQAKKFVKQHYPKLYIPEVKEFERVEEGVKFLQKTEEIWVLKGKIDSAKTFVPDSQEPKIANQQTIDVLQNFPEKYEKLGYILELRIPQIIEYTPQKIYYDGVFLGVTMNLENKSFGAGNLSVQTGCAEDLVFPIDPEDRIVKIAFPEIVDEMAKNHKGLFIWDASLLISKKDGKMYFGEFCSNRPGYNAFFTELAQCGDINGYFEKIVRKVSPYTMGTVAASVRIFDMNHDEDSEQMSSNILISFNPEVEKDLWFWDIKKDADGRLVTVGSDWNLVIATGDGKSIDEAVDSLYKNIEGLSVIGIYYRSKDDFLSLDYQSSILNRLNYGLERGLYRLPFNVMVGDIK